MMGSTWQDFSSKSLQALLLENASQAPNDSDDMAIDNFPIKGFAVQKPDLHMYLTIDNLLEPPLEGMEETPVNLLLTFEGEADAKGPENLNIEWIRDEGAEEFFTFKDGRTADRKIICPKKSGRANLTVKVDGVGTLIYPIKITIPGIYIDEMKPGNKSLKVTVEDIKYTGVSNYGLEIDKSTAHILLGAVLSDTYNLTGSTTTGADRQAVADLAEIAGVTDIEEFAKKIHEESLSYEGMSDEEILFSDYKEYEASGVKYGIGLMSAIDEETAMDLAKRMQTAMKENAEKLDVDLLYVSIGVYEGDVRTDYIVPLDGQSEETFKAAFPNYDDYNGVTYIFRSGLGRKTKFVPGMTDFLGAHPHE